jgi:hypothetical protein
MSDSGPSTVPWPPPNPNHSGIYALQCHCAAIRYQITISPPLRPPTSEQNHHEEIEGGDVYTALECDCTHCESKGIIACHPILRDVVFFQGLVRYVLENN